MMRYPESDRELANLGLEHWAEGLDDDNQLHLPSGDAPDWIEELQAEHDKTPEWARGYSLVQILGNLAYDLGVEAARLTMLQQRASEIMILVQEKKDVDSK